MIKHQQTTLSLLISGLLIISTWNLLEAQTTFQKTYGGSGAESGVNIINTQDGGYAIIGNAGSF